MYELAWFAAGAAAMFVAFLALGLWMNRRKIRRGAGGGIMTKGGVVGAQITVEKPG